MTEEKKITVAYKQPGRDPKLLVIDNTLEAFQTLVGRYIETVARLSPDLFVIGNEEGRIRGMESNVLILRNGWTVTDIVGPVFISKLGGDGAFEDMTVEEGQRALKWLGDHAL